MTSSTKAIPITILALLLSVGAYGNDNDTDNDVDQAPATAPTVEVNFSFGQKSFGDYDYEFVDATMRGTVERDGGSTGEYAVPIKLAYPVGGGNDVGVVDLVNSAVFVGSSQAEAGNPHACVRGRAPMFCDDEEGDAYGRAAEQHMLPWARMLADGLLLRQGYTYMALQWDKALLEHFGSEPPEGYRRHRLAYGFIEEPGDILPIIQQASRWLRDPSHFETSAAPDATPSATDHVVGTGISWSGIVNLQHDNEFEGGLFYDGFVWLVTAVACKEFIADWPYNENVPCPIALDGFLPWQTGDAKTIHVEDEGHVVTSPFYVARDPREGDPAFPFDAFGVSEPEGEPNPNYRQWEVTGVPHIATSFLNLTAWGAEAPLPHDFAPVARTAFYHMAHWLNDDVPPPPTAHLAGDEVDEEAFEIPPDIEDRIGEEASHALGLLIADRDEDGNVLGGIRLPFLPRELDDGTIAGAPLGRYVTFASEFMEQDPPNQLAALSGTFEPFSDEELAERYPTREEYLERYEAALDEVIAEGYVLEEDRGELLAQAGAVDIPDPPETPDLPDAAGECIGHACPEESGLDLPEGGVVRLGLVHQHDWAPEVRSSAWFAGDQTPESRPFPRPPEHWHIQDGDDFCRDLRDGDFFPGGDVEHRAYLDAGDAVQLVTDNAEITLPRVENGQDDATWQWHDILYRDHVPAADVATGAGYDVVLGGGEDLTATTYEGVLRIPRDFQVDFPDMDRRVVMPAGRDFRFLAEDHPDPHAFDYTFVSFADQFGPVGLCIGPPSGHITIPATFLEVMPYAGIVQFGFLNHQVKEREGRRIDFIGVNSREARYLIDNHYLKSMKRD